MKFYYFILLLFALLCFSCKKHNGSFDNTNTSYFRIDSLYDLSFSDNHNLNDRIKFTNHGILLAKKHHIDSLHLKGIGNKAYHYMDVLPDSSDYYIDELISTSKKKNNKKYLAYSYSLKGNSFFNQSRYDSAYFYFKNANVVYYDVNDSISLGYNQLMMARIHYFYNDYNASEELATQALEYLKKKNNSYVIETYNILGSIYKKSHKYDEAITYYQKALTLTEKKSLEESYLRNNIASSYIASKQYGKAKHTLYNLLDSELVTNDENLQSAVLLNLGNVLFRQDNNNGLQQILQSLQIRERANMELSLIENYIEIAQYYELKDKDVAIDYLKRALTLATKHKSIDNKILALKKLILLSKNNTANYSEEYIRVNDSITSVRNQAKNQFAKIRFDYSKELEQNQVLKSREIEHQLTIQKQKNNQLILCSIIGFVTILFYFIYYYIRNRHTKEKIEENYKTEQRIATRIHDELANDVYHTISYAENTDLSEGQNKVKLLDHLEDVYNRTRNISKENTLIPTGSEYVSYLKNMLLEFQDSQVKIITVGIDDFSWDSLNKIKKVVLYRIIQELLVNMKKHSQADLVVVKFSKSNKYAEIQYTDNGVGFDKSEKNIKNGLQNVETRIKTINGTITFDSKVKKGVKAVLRFPL
ncbi:MAG: tetratricopeptide repeat protein [Flavobacterium sp.]|uniref:tetratricopeptide repeat-containing sensor histidine kinase n=1 Tax=Flavobacterium sp. TaxID=239 RepID=UPI002FC62862